ncbi:MAG: hypothetical protein ACYS47_03855 [Planctomycetota bacterium]|jgi:hypothetical protein
MGRDEDLKSMLDDVLEEGELNTFRRTLADRCRRSLERKRSPRFLWVLPAAAAVLLALLLAVKNLPVRPPVTADPPEGTPVDTEIPRPALDALRIVRTVPLARDLLVATGDAPAVETIRTQSASSITVRSQTDGDVQRVTNAEFLDMLEGVPCGLVRDRDGRMNLVFLRPQDEERFMGGVE